VRFNESLETHRESFLESMRVRSYSKATLQCHSDSLSTFFGFLARRRTEDLREVTPELAKDYLRWLLKQNYTTWTAHVKLQGMRRFFEYLERADVIFLNPAQGIPLPKLEKRLPGNVLSLKEVRTVLDTPDTQTKRGIRDKALLELFYSTGIRVGEMTGLTIHDIDTRHGMVRVTKGKFARGRVVPMGRKASAYVGEYLSKVRSQWTRARRDERALWLASAAPFPPISRDGIEQIVSRYGVKAGLSRPLYPHLWRHTCATHLVAAGANIAHVQRLLGHRSLETTQIYTRVALPEVRKTFLRSHPRA